MHPLIHGYAAMSAVMAYIALVLIVVGAFRILTAEAPTAAKLRKAKDAIAVAHFGHLKFTALLWVGFTILYPATVGLVAIFRFAN